MIIFDRQFFNIYNLTCSQSPQNASSFPGSVNIVSNIFQTCVIRFWSCVQGLLNILWGYLTRYDASSFLNPFWHGPREVRSCMGGGPRRYIYFTKSLNNCFQTEYNCRWVFLTIQKKNRPNCFEIGRVKNIFV